MIDFYISDQTIRFATPVIAANTLDYLEAQFHFSGETWDDYSKWAHFKQGETVFDLNLVDDAISANMHLNLSIGAWSVYVTGTRGDSRLTTVPVILTVKESGLIDEPLHQIPLSVAEQIDDKATLALSRATAVETAAENGDFDGKNFQVLGYYDSLAELAAAITEPERGDAYGIGELAPYEIYVYDGVGEQWVNNGSIQGAQGETGESGATYTPHIADNGNLSWTNDKGLENPATANIIGPQGIQGASGADGASPFEAAVEEGFTGTEATFNWALAHIASHASAHAAGGTDPLPPGITAQVFTATLRSDGWSATAPYSQVISISGISSGVNGSVDTDLSEISSVEGGESILEAWGYVSRVYASAANAVTAICFSDVPDVDIPIRLIVFGNAGPGENVAYYSGSYSVTPSGDAQTLETENLVMTDDVEINGIPSSTVSNESGQTVIIG